MSEQSAATRRESPPASASRLNTNVIGACLRSAFIEALYDDCSDLLPSNEAPAPAPLRLAAE